MSYEKPYCIDAFKFHPITDIVPEEEEDEEEEEEDDGEAVTLGPKKEKNSKPVFENENVKETEYKECLENNT